MGARGIEGDANGDPAARPCDVRGSSFDRRTLLLGGAGALVAAALPYAAPAGASAGPAVHRAARRFDPALARRLQRILREAVRDPRTHYPGAILHVHGRSLASWTGVAGLGRVAPNAPMRPTDRFRAGSIAKSFVAVVVLQLAERGRLSLDARLPEVLPASVTGRFPTAPAGRCGCCSGTAAASPTG